MRHFCINRCRQLLVEVRYIDTHSQPFEESNSDIAVECGVSRDVIARRELTGFLKKIEVDLVENRILNKLNATAGTD